MKTKQFTLPNGDYIAVEAASKSLDHCLQYDDRFKTWSLHYRLPNKQQADCCGSTVLLVKDFGGRKNYPQAERLKLVGCSANMSEMDWKNLLPSVHLAKPNKNMFIDYMSENSFNEFSKPSAKAAGQSLIKYLGFEQCVFIEILPNG